MASYKEFRTNNQKRRLKRKLQRYGIIALVAVLILVVAFFIVKLLEKPENTDEPSASTAPPSANSATSEGPTQYWKPDGPVEQTINFEIIVPDTRMIAVPSNGRIETGYFDDAMFVGDSLTQGFPLYNVMPNAMVVAYKGIGPQGFEGIQTLADGTQVIPLDQITAAYPRKIYMMLGTNSLVNLTNEAFLAYYGDLIDKLLERVPGVEIYVQSILPVSGKTAAERPNLDNNRIRAVNDELAKLAFQKGVYFLNVQEVYTDGEGNMMDSAIWEGGDGIHLTPEGYNPWRDYVYTHVAHKKGNPYVPGSPYYDNSLT